MKKLFFLTLICLALLLGTVLSVEAVATKMYGRDALLGATKSCDNILVPLDGYLCQVVDSSKYYWLYVFDDGSSETEADPWYADPDDTTTGDWVLIYNPGNGHKSLANANETQVQISVKDWYQNKSWDNVGQYAGEADWQLPSFGAHGVTRIIEVSVAQNIEICPETGGFIRLNGELLTVNYCVNSDSTLGSKIAVTRAYDSANTRWENQLDTVSGAWTSLGATSD